MASWPSQPAFNAQAYGQQTEYSGQHEANVIPNPSQNSYSQGVAAHHGQPPQLAPSYLQPQQTQQTSYAQQPSSYQPTSYPAPQQLPMSSGYQLPVSNYTSTGPNYQPTFTDKSTAGVLATPVGYAGAYTPQSGQTSAVDATGRGQVSGSSAWSNRVASAPAVTPVSGMIGGQAPQPRPPVLTGGPGHAENLAGRMASGWAQPEADSASGWLHGGSSGLLKDGPTSFGTQKPGEFPRSGSVFKPQASVATPGLWQPPPQLLDQRLQSQAGILDARREERELDLQREEMGWQQTWSEYNGHPQGVVGNPRDPRLRPEDRHAFGMSNNAAGVLGGGMRSSAQQLDPMADPMRGGQYNNYGGDGILFDSRRGPIQMDLSREMMGPGPMFEQPYQEPHGGMEYHHGHPVDIHPQQPHGFGPRGPGVGAGPARRPRGPWAKQQQQEAVQSRSLGQKRSWQQSNPPPRFQRPLQEPRAKRAAGSNSTQATNASGSPGWCDFCKLDCGTLDALQSHVNGKRHKRKLKLVEEEKEKAEGGPAPAVAAEKEQGVAERGEKEGGEAEAEEQAVQKYQCRVCLVECSGLGNLREHRLGKKHKKELDRLRERGEYVDDSVPPELLEAMAADALAKAADPSAVPLSGPAAQTAASEALAQTVSADAALASGMAVEVGAEWKCIPCNVPCNSRHMLESHLNGKKHKAKLEGPPADGKKKEKAEGTEDAGGGTKKAGRKAKRGQNKAQPENAEAVAGTEGGDVKSEAVGLDIDVKEAADAGTEREVKEAADAGTEGGDVKESADAGTEGGDVKEAANADVDGIASEVETGFDLNVQPDADASPEVAKPEVDATAEAADPEPKVVVNNEETMPDATVEVEASVSEAPEGVDNPQADTDGAVADASEDVTATTAPVEP